MPNDPPGKLQRQPFVVECAPGKHAYCMCRHSRQFPYCDGTHRGTEISPIKVMIEEAKTVAWCACGDSANKPYCDGSHRSGSED